VPTRGEEICVDWLADPLTFEDDLSARRRSIAEAVEQCGDDLMRSARLLANRCNLPDPDEALADVAADLVQSAVVRALEIADKFDPSKPARPWLAGILVNVTKEERRRRYRRRQRSVSIRSATGERQRDDGPDAISDEDLLDRLRRQGDESDPAGEINLNELLSLVSTPDQEVLRLSVVEDLSGRDVATRLGISEGAAYVRLHRALEHLRAAYRRWDEPMKRAN
jgi:RNA polymerase sigma-70 factor (ECF subfamily)